MQSGSMKAIKKNQKQHVMLSPGDRLWLGGDAEHPQPLGVAVHVPEEPQRHRGVHPHQHPARTPVSREHLNSGRL